MSEENKALVRRINEEIWNQGKVEVADEIIIVDGRLRIDDAIHTQVRPGRVL